MQHYLLQRIDSLICQGRVMLPLGAVALDTLLFVARGLRGVRVGLRYMPRLSHPVRYASKGCVVTSHETFLRSSAKSVEVLTGQNLINWLFL